MLLFVLSLPLGSLINESLVRSPVTERLLLQADPADGAPAADAMPALTELSESAVLPSWPAGVTVTVSF